MDAQGHDRDIVNKTILYAHQNILPHWGTSTPFEIFVGRPMREPTDLIFSNVGVLLDLADKEMITSTPSDIR